MQDVPRRDVIRVAALGALAFTVGGAKMLLTPQQANAQNVAFRTLKPEEVETIEALGETLVPDAKKSGIAHFIDHHLSVPAEDCLLEARIMNVRPPYANFYRAAVTAVEGAVGARHGGKRFAALTPDEARAFVNDMRQNKIDGWKGPPGGFVYFLLRSDAVDVVYGTMEGYERLGIPYMPHIAPDKKW
jgi:hypothetical protein